MSQLNSQRTYLYLLYNEIIYDTLCNNYVNILTLNKSPEGALKPYTKLMALTKPYTRDLITTTKECAIVINNSITNAISSYSNILTLNELNEFTEFLINNNYIITEHSYSTTNNSTTYNNTSSNSTKKIIYSFKITL
jgi:hypothetical protein